MKTILIDPGHGGWDPGAVKNGLTEAHVTLKLAKLVAHYVTFLGKPEVGKPSAANVLLSRYEDLALGKSKADDLEARWRKASGHHADLLLSLHCNSSVSPLARGAEALISARGSYKRLSRVIGSEILDRLKAIGLKDRGIHADKPPWCRFNGLAVLRGGCWRRAAVLVEVGFLSNKRDAAMLKDPESLDTIAREIAAGALEGLGIKPNFEVLKAIER